MQSTPDEYMSSFVVVVTMRNVLMASGRRLSMTRVLTLAVLAVCLLGTALVPLVDVTSARADSLQESADSLNTGWYPNQTLLTASSVSTGFGQLFDDSLPSTGKIYAQPLVSNGTVLVVTENDTAYGVNANTGNVNWHDSFGTPAAPAVNGTNVCGDVGPQYGITGTPVIDPSTGIAYFVSAQGPGAAQYFMEAVYVSTGLTPSGWPAGGVPIQGSADRNHSTVFDGGFETQRPGLVMVNGVVYAAFSAQCDYAPPAGSNSVWTGWLVGVSTVTASITSMWASMVGGLNGGGIWQSGGAPVVDANGNIFLTTGNSHSVAYPAPLPGPGTNPQTNFAEAVVELSTAGGTLNPIDWFIPSNYLALDQSDLDFGSGGPVELPASMGSSQEPHVLLQVGKEGTLYSLNMNALGGFEDGAGQSDAVPSQTNLGSGVWSRPAVWPGDGGYIYVPTISAANASGGSLIALHRYVSASGAVGFQQVATAGYGTFAYGSGAPIVTSNGTTSGSALVWSVHEASGSGVGAQLEAFDPVPQYSQGVGTLRMVYQSPTFIGEKFQAPGVGNNALYVGTQDGHLLGFGFTASTPALSADNVDYSPSVVGQTSSMTATFTATTATTVTGLAWSGSAFPTGTQLSSPVQLNAGQTLSVPVTFTPDQIGTETGTLTASTLTGGTPGTVVVTLEGQGLGATSTLSASPVAVDFGVQPIGGSPPPSQRVTLTNNSNAPFNITGFVAPPEPFMVSDPLANSTLAPGNSVFFDVSYSPPGSSGNFAHVFGAMVTVQTSVGDFGIPLSGSANPPAQLAILPTSLSFNGVPVGSAVTENFTVENNGGLPLTITESTPPSSNGFSATSSEPSLVSTVIAANSAVQESVQFDPTSTGTFAATWTFTSDDGTGQKTLTLSGTGVAPPPPPPPPLPTPAVTSGKLVLSTKTLNFGDVPVGTSSSQTFAIANSGAGPLTITSSSPPDVTPFATTSTLHTPTVIAPDSSIDETVSFSPSALGAASASWSITGDDGSGPQTLTVSGVGVAGVPGAPTRVLATTGSSAALIDWTAPSSSGGALITGYRATANDESNGARGGESCTTSGATSCTVPGLFNGDVYSFSVVAFNSVGTGPSSPPSKSVRPLLPTLRLLTRAGRASVPLTLRTAGDFSGGASSFVVVDGTAVGCRVINSTLVSSSGGSCVVVALKAALGLVPAVLSAPTFVKMSGRETVARAVTVGVPFVAGTSILSLHAQAIVTALARVLKPGANIVITGSGSNSLLAKSRARAVEVFLTKLIRVKVTIVVAHSSVNSAIVREKLRPQLVRAFNSPRRAL